jgi:hypothetical protein
MSLWNLMAVVLTLSGVFGYLDYRYLGLPQTIAVIAPATRRCTFNRNRGGTRQPLQLARLGA